MKQLTWTQWISNRRYHTCGCGHVAWAHWPNGQCAHCECKQNDAKPQPKINEDQKGSNK